MPITAERYHDISCGHRVVGHEGKCRHLHGHNYRIFFTIEADQLDSVGRVLDFGVIKEKLCMWLEENWDHKFLAWQKDLVMQGIEAALRTPGFAGTLGEYDQSIVWMPFNPTAENIAEYLVNVIAPVQLQDTGARLIKCTVEETRKCAATYEVYNDAS